MTSKEVEAYKILTGKENIAPVCYFEKLVPQI